MLFLVRVLGLMETFDRYFDVYWPRIFFSMSNDVFFSYSCAFFAATFAFGSSFFIFLGDHFLGALSSSHFLGDQWQPLVTPLLLLALWLFTIAITLILKHGYQLLSLQIAGFYYRKENAKKETTMTTSTAIKEGSMLLGVQDLQLRKRGLNMFSWI